MTRPPRASAAATYPGGATCPPPGVQARPAAVLWDMDGTLVDAEQQWIDAQREVLRRRGAAWSYEQGAQLVGHALPTSGRVLADHLAQTGGDHADPDDLVTEMLDVMVEKLSVEVTWRPGALDLLGDLHRRGVPCALVTMSYRRLTTVVVDQLPEPFNVLVCGEDVTRGKPAPDPYLRAADLLGVSAADCVAIEDSPTGVASAEAAGCRILACPSLLPITFGPGRTVVTSLCDVDFGLLAEMVSTPRASPSPMRIPSDT